MNATFTHTLADDINALIGPGASTAAVRQPLTGESMIVYASPPPADDETEPQTMHVSFDNVETRDRVLRLIWRIAQEMRGEQGS